MHVDLQVNYITSTVKEGINGSNKHARRCTRPTEVLITIEQEGWSSL